MYKRQSHVYLPLIKRLRDEGMALELIEPTGIPNKEVRFLQVQADIFLDMLTFGWFGANAREAMMLAKPVICYIRPEWLESLREEIPEYADQLPIVSATPQTVEAVLRDLIANPEKRREIGLRSREFAMRWHSDTAAGRRFDRIYSEFPAGNPLLRVKGRSRIDRAPTAIDLRCTNVGKTFAVYRDLRVWRLLLAMQSSGKGPVVHAAGPYTHLDM